MKLISFIARLALVGVSAFLLGFTFDVQALALFAFAIGALFLLVVAGDYAPLLSDPVPSADNLMAFPPQRGSASAQKLAA